MTDDIVKDVKTACNYSEAIEQVGREAGLEAGRQEGKAEGEAKLACLMQNLFSLNRDEDAKKAAVDVVYRAKLYNEFQMA